MPSTSYLLRRLGEIAPMAQFCAVGGISTSVQGDCEFHVTLFAPAHPCPVPNMPRLISSMPALPVTLMLSQSVALAHFWCGPTDCKEFIALSKTKTLGPAVLESCVTKGAWAPNVVLRWMREYWPFSASPPVVLSPIGSRNSVSC